MNQKLVWLQVAGMLIICLLVSPGLDLIAQEEPLPQAQNVEIVGQIGGVSRAIVVQGEYAYLGVGPRVIILKVDDPAHPVLIGQTSVFPGIVNDIELVGNTIYVATSTGGVQIVDSTDPTKPKEIGTYYMSGAASGLSIKGNTLYVADEEIGLRTVDITNPSEPEMVHLLELPRYVTDVTVLGNVAYTFGANYLYILDITDPDSPKEVDSIFLGSGAGSIAAYENTIYIAPHENNVLEVLDATNSISPRHIGSFGTRVRQKNVTVSGLVACVVDDEGYMYLIDTSNPSDPRELSVFRSDRSYSSLDDVTIAGTIAYAADGGGGLHLIDIGNPSFPVEVGFYDTPGSTEEVTIVGNMAYITDGGSHPLQDQGEYILRAIDISNPQFPVEAGWASSLATSSDILGSENIAHILSHYYLHFIEASDPNALKYIDNGFFDPFVSNYALDMAINGTTAYIVSNEGIQLVDVTNPSNPVKLGFYNAEGLGIEVANNVAFVAGYGGLLILDVSNPAAPIRIGQFGTPGQGMSGSTSDIALAGKFVYLSESGALFIVDIENPQIPELMGVFDSTFQVEKIAASENDVFLASAFDGLQVIDVTDPTSPVEVGYYDTSGFAADIAVTGEFVVVADAEGGLQILRYLGGTLEPLDAKETITPAVETEVPTATQTISTDATSIAEAPSSGLLDSGDGSSFSPNDVTPDANGPTSEKGIDWVLAMVYTGAGLIVIAAGWILIRHYLNSVR